MWLIIICGQFLEGWYQGFYQYQLFCWNFIKVFCTYHKLGHFQGKRSLDKRRDFSVYVLKINAQEWCHARGILEYANTTIQWNPRYNEKGVYYNFKVKLWYCLNNKHRLVNKCHLIHFTKQGKYRDINWYYFLKI